MGAAQDRSSQESQGVQSVWAELNLHVQRSKGLSLVFLCSDSPTALEWLRVRLNDAWVWRTAPSVLLKPSSNPDAASQILKSLQAEVANRPAVRSPVWVDLAEVDSAGAFEWDAIRSELMSRLNEWRSWLQAEFRRPLIFALPLSWRRKMPQVAPDLWHVRTFSAAVSDLGAYDRVTRMESWSGGPQLPQTEGLDGLTWTVSKLLDSGQVDAATSVAESKVVELRPAVAGGGLETQRALAIALFALGYAYRYAGRDSDALGPYSEALTILRSLRKVFGDSEGVLRDLAVGLSKYGDAQRHVEHIGDALAAYQESSQLWRALHSLDSASVSAIRDLAVILSKYGNALAENGQVNQAVKSLSESVELCRAVRVKSNDSSDSIDDLAMSLDFLCNAQRLAGSLSAAQANCGESIALRRYLLKSSDSRESIRNLAVSLGRAGALYRQARDGERAVVSCRESVELFRRLRAQLGDDAVVLQNLAISLLGLGESFQIGSQHKEAQSVFAEAIALLENLRSNDVSEAATLRDLSAARMYLADATADLNEVDAAIRMYDQSRRVADEAGAKYGKQRWVPMRVADCMQKSAQLLHRKGKALEAVPMLRQVVELRRSMAEQDESADAQRDVSVALGLLGDALSDAGRIGEALVTYEESVARFRLPAQSLGDGADALIDLQRTLVMAGEAHRSIGEIAGARAKFGESLDIARRLRKILGDSPVALEALASSLESLACLGRQYADLELSEPIALLREAVGIRERLAQAFPTVNHHQQSLRQAKSILSQLSAAREG